MPHTTTKKEREMNDFIPIGTLVLTLLNLGLVIIALVNLKGLRKDLRTPVVKSYNPDFKRKSVDIPKPPESFGKKDRDDRQKNRPKNNNSQQNRPMAVRRPVAKAPDVFSNEIPIAPAPEGRRPLPPRSVAAAQAELAPPAPAPNYATNDIEDAGMEFDRSKMAHGRRNVVAKPVIEDDDAKENV